MEYPKNGSIVVVDDKIEEVDGIIRTLSINGAPIYYLNGDIDSIPFIDNIRIIFLDLDLGVDGNDIQKVAKIMILLKKLIPEDNGDYIIVAWSSLIKNLYRKLLIEILKDCKAGKKFIKKKPYYMFSVSKQDVVNGDGQPDLSKVKTKIDKAIKNDSIKNLFILWENMAKESSSKVIKTLESLINDEKTAKELAASFAHAIADVKNIKEKDVLNYSLLPLSNLLIDQLSKETSTFDKTSLANLTKEIYTIAQTRTSISKEIVSKINTFYHIDESPSSNFMPGNVYFYRDYIVKLNNSGNSSIKWAADLEKKFLLKSIKFKANQFDAEFQQLSQPEQSKIGGKKKFPEFKTKYILENESIPIFMEISADCDYVQNNRKKLRLIYGVLIPACYQISSDSDSIIGIKPDVIIEYDNKSYWVIFDTHLVTAVDPKVFEKTNSHIAKINSMITQIKTMDEIKAQFRFRKEFVVDIQHKVASHFSRPGFFNMGDYS
ncbi:MAG: hypothetical protein ACNI3H_04015 [Halarcobacter ebronensis]|uniref:hypothetical protein n=1 Tax=Halarcobacter ebronensis TaxID=1462615 RepID=UPI003C70D269